jgi:hypothetical protein
VLLTSDLFADALVAPDVIDAASRLLADLHPRTVVVVAGPADPPRPGCALTRLNVPAHVHVAATTTTVDLGWLLVHACPTQSRVADPIAAAKPIAHRLQVAIGPRGGARTSGLDAVLIDDGEVRILTVQAGKISVVTAGPWLQPAPPSGHNPAPTEPPAPPVGFVSDALQALLATADPDDALALQVWPQFAGRT